MSDAQDCTCIYGVNEAGLLGLLSKRPYCPLHDKDAHERREHMARLGSSDRGGVSWAGLADDERDRWRAWAEIELEHL